MNLASSIGVDVPQQASGHFERQEVTGSSPTLGQPLSVIMLAQWWCENLETSVLPVFRVAVTVVTAVVRRFLPIFDSAVERGSFGTGKCMGTSS